VGGGGGRSEVGRGGRRDTRWRRFLLGKGGRRGGGGVGWGGRNEGAEGSWVGVGRRQIEGENVNGGWGRMEGADGDEWGGRGGREWGLSAW